jgi:uncharacterized integral membrane protein (TIGR00697 family)
MINELIFLLHAVVISCAALYALHLGKQALVAFISVQCILANLFVLKQTTLFGLTATCADPFTIGAVLGLNLLQEYYDRKSATSAVWTSFFLLIFYAVVSYIHLLYIPALHDTMQPHYVALLQFMPRITVASFSVYLFVQYIDTQLFGFLKKVFGGRYLPLRNMLSIGTTQLLDTVLFSFLGLYGIVHNIGQIIMISYSIKLLALAISTPFVALSKKIRQQTN